MSIYLTRFFFFFNDTAPPEIYTLSLHDALPIFRNADLADIVQRRGKLDGLGLVVAEAHRAGDEARVPRHADQVVTGLDRKSTRLNSSHRCISYAVFCLKKKKKKKEQNI